VNAITDIYKWQRGFVFKSFLKGMRSKKLGSQPAPWMIKGLQAIESGKFLTVDMIKLYNS